MSKNKTIPIREFLRFQPKELLYGYKTNNTILFEDGILRELDYKEVVVIRYVLESVISYPELKLTTIYDVTKYYTNGIFTNKTLNKCFEQILKEVIQQICIPHNRHDEILILNKKMVTIYNNIYKDIGCDHIEYSTSSNILDYLEIQMDPKLLSSIKNVYEKKDVDSIEESYNILDNILRNDSKYVNNPIAKSYVSGMVNENQIKQILGPRGYVTEIDGSIFKHPIASSFTLGMNSIYDLAIESRSGAKALFLSNKAVQDSEYLARELQLVAMVVSKLHMGDCGNRNYISWYVRPAANGIKSDLNKLIGKRYLDKESGTEKIITSDDIHLEGTTIKLRSVLHCKHVHSKHICSHCFGELSYAVNPNDNIGHYCTASITQKITQSILSTKHLTTSATTNTVKLEGDAAKFFIVKEKDGVAFRANVLNKAKNRTYLIITQEEAFGLKDLTSVNDIPKLDPTRVSKIESMIVVVENKIGREHYIAPIKDGGKYGSFTHKFLEYIVTNGYTLDSKDRYVIDVTDWKYNSPILTLPQLEFSYLELAKAAKMLLKYIKIVKGTKFKDTPETLLQKFFDLINSKLEVNIALMEVLIYAFTIRSYENKDFRIAKNAEEQEVADIAHIMPNRSVGGLYAWEFVSQNMVNASSFNTKHRVSHPLDVMIKPTEALQNTKNL